MTQNIYDNPQFFEGYGQLTRSLEGLPGAAEWPAMRALLPDMSGLRVVDLGCGYGWFCRWARDAGAAQVLGIDVSEKMLERAKATTSDPGIIYAKADLERLELAAASADLVYSSLAFHYIAGLAGLFEHVHAAMVPGARLVFSIEHPIYMAPMHPEWSVDIDGHKTWPLDSYLIEGPRTTDWLAKNVVKQHRTIGTTLNLLIRAGFVISHVEEWGPTEAQVAARPDLAEHRQRPMFLLIAAHR